MGRFPGGGGGAGSISEIVTDTPSFLTITNPTGPTTELDVSGPTGTISDITTDTPSFLTITNPTGPTTNLTISGTGVDNLTTTQPATVLITNPSGPTTNIDIVSAQSGGSFYSANAPGGTPMSAVSLLQYNVVQLTGIATAITDMTPSVMPTDPTYLLRFVFMDNGTPQAITWGSSYEVSSELPLTTLGGGVNPIPLQAVFWYNSVTTKLVCVGVSAVTGLVVADAGSGSVSIGTSSTPIFASPPSLTPGIWRLDFDSYITTSTGVAAGDTVTFEVAGGSATYTVVPCAPSGNNPGIKLGAPSATIANDKLPIHLTAYVKVTATGTVNIAGIGSSAFFSTTGHDTTFPSTTLQVTTLHCLQVG